MYGHSSHECHVFFFFFFLQWKVAVQRDCLVLCGNQTGIMLEPLISWAFVPLVLKHCKNGMRARRKMFYWIPCCDSVPCVKNLSGLRAVTAWFCLFVCVCLCTSLQCYRMQAMDRWVVAPESALSVTLAVLCTFWCLSLEEWKGIRGCWAEGTVGSKWTAQGAGL